MQRAASLIIKNIRRFARSISCLVEPFRRHWPSDSFGNCSLPSYLQKPAPLLRPSSLDSRLDRKIAGVRSRRSYAFSRVVAISTVTSIPISSIKRNGPIGIPHFTSPLSIFSASTPFSNNSAASSRYGNKTRLTKNPGLSRTTTGNFPICRTKASACSFVSSQVSWATTTSTSFIRLTGLKKCKQITGSGDTVQFASSTTRSVRNFLELLASFLVFFRQEKIANQILGRFGLAKIDNRIELELERFIDRIRCAGRDNAERTRTRRFWIGRNRSVSFRRRHFCSRTFSFADQTSRCVEELLS